MRLHGMYVRITSVVWVTMLYSGTAYANSHDLETGGKLLLTNGITSVDGSSGGGLANWAVIAGKATEEGIGASVHTTLVELPDYRLHNYGIAIGLFDRIELSYARQNLDTKSVGGTLGLGKGFKLNQDIFGAKLRLLGDVVYGAPMVPQISVGAQYHKNLDAPVAVFVGASKDTDFDLYITATKLVLARSLLVNGTIRYTRANQFGLLGFGGDRQTDRSVEFEGSLGYQFSRRFILGGEYRTKPDNLSIAQENDAFDMFAAWAIDDNFTLTAAYVDLGNIVIKNNQRGAFLSLQAAF